MGGDAAARNVWWSLIEGALLDARQFFGPVPFPSVAYDEPTSDPKGYWRGRSWPHISYWLIAMLHREGYRAEAVKASRRTLLRDPEAPWFPRGPRQRPPPLRGRFGDRLQLEGATALMLAGKEWQDS